MGGEFIYEMYRCSVILKHFGGVIGIFVWPLLGLLFMAKKMTQGGFFVNFANYMVLI